MGEEIALFIQVLWNEKVNEINLTATALLPYILYVLNIIAGLLKQTYYYKAIIKLIYVIQ